MKERRPILDMALIAFLAILSRVAFVALQAHADPLLFLPVVDEMGYLDAARAFASSFSLSGLELPFWQPPGYVFLLSFWLALGAGPTAFVYLQMAVGVINAVLIYRLALGMFGEASRRYALIGSVAFTLCPAMLYFETKLLKPVWDVALLLLLLAALHRRRHPALFGAAGVLTGILALFEGYFILVPLLVVWLYRTMKGKLLFYLAGVVLALAPIAALNVTVGKQWVLISYNGPVNAYVGNNPHWITTYNTLPGWDWDRMMHRHTYGSGKGFFEDPDRTAAFREDVRNFVLSDPGRFARGLLEKAFLLFSCRDLPRNSFFFYHPVLAAWSYAYNALAIAVCAALLVAGWGRSKFLLSILVVILAVNVLFFPTTRYRVLAFPLVWIAFAGVPALERPHRLAVPAVAALLISLVSGALCSNWVDFAGWQAFAYRQCGLRHVTVKQDAEGAREFFKKALAMRRDHHSLYMMALFAMNEGNDLPEAARFYEEALAVQPEFAIPHYYLGEIAERQGAPDRAYRHYSAFVRLMEHGGFGEKLYAPILFKAYQFLANTDAQSGRLKEALERLEVARTLLERHGSREPGPMNALRERITALERTYNEKNGGSRE